MTDKQKEFIANNFKRWICDIVIAYSELGLSELEMSVDTHKEVKEIYDIKIVKRGGSQ
jgi:hypothetical protein